MSLLNPLALALLALLPPIIALYLLKVRREERTVSSTYLWRRFVRDVEASAPWQRLQRNLLLLLQLLFMLLLILALTRPARESALQAGRLLVLVLDTSASMAATDVDGRSRLDAAQAHARELVAQLPSEAQVTVIAAATNQADLLTAATTNRREVYDALAQISVSPGGSDLSTALALAEALAARDLGTEIILLSDGAVPPLAVQTSLRSVSFGQSEDNQAITAIDLSPPATPDGPATLFLQINNFAPRDVERRLSLYVDDALYTAVDLQLPPGDFQTQVFDLPATTQQVAAVLVPNANDDLALDDRAWAVQRQGGQGEIVLVSEGNFFLQTALNVVGREILGPGFAPQLRRPTLTTTNTIAGPALHIFDATVPETLPPGNLLFIAPPQSVPGLFTVTRTITQPQAGLVQPEHPLLADLNPAAGNILSATEIIPSAWGQTLLEGRYGSDRVPLLIAGNVEGRRVAILSFNLRHSDLPLRPDFPILVSNLLRYLAPGLAGLAPAQLAADESLTVSLPPGIDALDVQTAAGPRTRYTAQAGRLEIPSPDQPGLYTLSAVGPAATDWPPSTVAVNFINPAESNIAPQRLTFTLNPGEAETAAPLTAPSYQEWWRPLALAALAFLLLEWLLAQRSTLLWWWSRLRTH